MNDMAELSRIIQQSTGITLGITGGPYVAVGGDELRRVLAESPGPLTVAGQPITYACGWRDGEKVGEWGTP